MLAGAAVFGVRDGGRWVGSMSLGNGEVSLVAPTRERVTVLGQDKQVCWKNSLQEGVNPWKGRLPQLCELAGCFFHFSLQSVLAVSTWSTRKLICSLFGKGIWENTTYLPVFPRSNNHHSHSQYLQCHFFFFECQFCALDTCQSAVSWSFGHLYASVTRWTGVCVSVPACTTLKLKCVCWEQASCRVLWWWFIHNRGPILHGLSFASFTKRYVGMMSSGVAQDFSEM